MTDSIDRTALVVFARAPNLEGKRLGLGREGDHALALGLVRHTLRVAHAACARTPVARAVLVSAGDLDVPATHDWIRLRQRGTGFQDRFLRALEDVFALGFDRVVVIGGDTPGLHTTALQRSLTSPRGQLWIGPSPDGGVYLLALDRDAMPLLRDLPWCTAQLRRALMARARKVPGLRIRLLRSRRDVDGARDVARLRDDLQRMWIALFRRPLWRTLAAVLQRPARRACASGRAACGTLGMRAPPRPA